MGLIITSTITDSTGGSITNAYMWAKFHTDTLEVDGKVKCDLFFYRSEADREAGKENIYPVDSNNMKIGAAEYVFIGDETITSSGICKLSTVIAFFYSKLQNELSTKYNWSFQS